MQIEPDGRHDPGAADRTMPRDPPRLALASPGLRSLATASPRTEVESFRIELHFEGETVRVAPVGELDLLTVRPLREQLDELRESGCPSVVLDLRGVTFMDASGLHLIVSCNVHARESGIEFVILEGPPVVRRLFDITGLVDGLTFRDRAPRSPDEPNVGRAPANDLDRVAAKPAPGDRERPESRRASR